MRSNDFQELIGTFMAETQEFLKGMEMELLKMETDCSLEERQKSIKTMFRAAHSIKGSAAMFGCQLLSESAHLLEDSFAILRDRANLSEIKPEIITALLEGVDCLKKLTIQVEAQTPETEGQPEKEAIATIKQQLEEEYGKPTTDLSQAQSTNRVSFPTIKAIFESDIVQVFNQLETELSQVTEENLEKAIAAINEIYYQLSGVAGMLQMAEFGQIVEQLRQVIDTPNICLETLQEGGWEVAQNLQTARQDILAEKPITIKPLTLLVEEKQEELETDQEEEIPAKAEESQPESLTDILEENPVSSPIPKQAETEKFQAKLQDTSPTPPVTSTPFQRPSIRVDLERLTELVNLVGELVINRTNLELQETQLRTESKRIRKRITNLRQFGGQLREEYDRLSSVDGRSPNNPITPYHSTFDTLELDQYTEFHSTAQSVIETTGLIAESATKIDDLSQGLERSTDQLRRITDNLRSRVMQLRVVPFSRAVDHLPRALRELCRQHNKEANLLLIGRDTTIDESLIDALREPLVHLLRNAFDHGIESPEERVATGKPPTGQIEIEARHQGGQTIITISDDGRGIDPEKLRSQAITKGLVTPEQAADLSVAELYEFLFFPGFSTATQVSDLSGRGVGLDVVAANLRQVRGLVKVDSRVGKGTSFILKLPLMLSITDALLVKVDHNTVAVPLDAIEEILHITASQIQTAGSQLMLHWREEFIRLVRLQELLHYSNPNPDLPSPDPIDQDYIPVMVLSTSEQVLAVAVERLVGQQEIVVKALPLPLSKPKGIVGNTILGDGRVVVILDVDDLIGNASGHTEQAVSVDADSSSRHTVPAVSASQPKILVVDDSYTIRQLLSLTLKRGRYRVIQAKDGQDALAKLNQGTGCDLAIVDIEMPRMDGFELLQNLKSSPTYSSIPVAMLTSRSGFKHRKMAFELGAVEYFTKPYNEAQLLEAIAKLLQSSKNNQS